MISICRTRTLRALRTSLASAQAEAEAASALAERYRQDAEIASDSAIRAEIVVEELREAHTTAIADAARAEGELSALRAQVFLDTEDRAVLRMLLRQARKTAGPRNLYVLLRRGQFHSLHQTRDAAEEAAEREGAPKDGWITQGRTGPQYPADEVAWRIQPVPLKGSS